VPFALGDTTYEKLPNIKRHLHEINERPAAQRAEALKTRFTFKAELDAAALQAMFPSNARLAA
jgi:GST-like protein